MIGNNQYAGWLNESAINQHVETQTSLDYSPEIRHIAVVSMTGINLTKARTLSCVQHMGDSHKSQILFVLSGGTENKAKDLLTNALGKFNRKSFRLRISNINSWVNFITVHVINSVCVVATYA